MFRRRSAATLFCVTLICLLCVVLISHCTTRRNLPESFADGPAVAPSSTVPSTTTSVTAAERVLDSNSAFNCQDLTTALQDDYMLQSALENSGVGSATEISEAILATYGAAGSDVNAAITACVNARPVSAANIETQAIIAQGRYFDDGQ